MALRVVLGRGYDGAIFLVHLEFLGLLDALQCGTHTQQWDDGTYSYAYNLNMMEQY